MFVPFFFFLGILVFHEPLCELAVYVVKLNLNNLILMRWQVAFPFVFNVEGGGEKTGNVLSFTFSTRFSALFSFLEEETMVLVFVGGWGVFRP